MKHSVQFLLALSVGAIVLELFLRLTGIAQPLWTEIDLEKGKLFKSNEELVFYNEGFSLLESDENGFVSFKSNKEGARRFNFYGDSYSEAHQVFKRHHFLHHLSTKSIPYDCVNLSMSAFDFSDSYARYLIFDSILEADHSFFFLSDDDFDQDDTDPFIPTVHENEDDLALFVLDKNALQSPKIKWLLPLLRNSALLHLARSAYRQVESGNTIEILFDGLLTSPEVNTPKSIEISPVIQKILTNWNRRNCTIVYRGKRPMPKEYRNLLQAYQIPLIDLEQALRRQLKGKVKDLYFHKGTNTSGHWNVEAHALIADILYEKISRRFK